MQARADLLTAPLRILLVGLLASSCAARQPATAPHAPSSAKPDQTRSGDVSNEPIAPPPSGPPAAAEASSGWISAAGTSVPPALFARESGALNAFKFSSVDGRYSGRALAAASPRVDLAKEGGVPQLRIPIGANQPITCALHDGQIHPGVRLEKMVQNLSKKLTGVTAVPVSVVAAAGAPLIFIDVLYAAEKEGKKSTGELKVAFLTRASASLICTHDGVGYRRTFEEAVQAVAESVRDSQAHAAGETRFAELNVLRAAQQLLGYSLRTVMAPRPDGAHDEYVSSFSFDRIDGPQLATRDLVATEQRNASGQLRHAKYSLSRNGAWSSLSVEEEPDGSYSVRGTADDRPLSGTLRPNDWLTRPSGAALLEVASGAHEQLAFDAYSPYTPLELQPTRVKRASSPNRVVASDGSGSEETWTLDESGAIVRAVTRTPDFPDQSTERIWSQGTP